VEIAIGASTLEDGFATMDDGHTPFILSLTSRPIVMHYKRVACAGSLLGGHRYADCQPPMNTGQR
jgi:hypothetical protein